MDIRERSLSERLSEEIFNRVHEDIGQASMCWDDDGVFQSDEASKIAFNLCHYIADKIDEARAK